MSKWIPGEVIAYKKGVAVIQFTFIVDQQGLFNSKQLWNFQRKMLVWTYQVDGMTELLTVPRGNQWLVVGATDVTESSAMVRVAIVDIPTNEIEISIASVIEEQLYSIRPGIEVRIDSGVTDTRILNGQKNC